MMQNGFSTARRAAMMSLSYTMKLADILFSLLSVCLSVCTQSSLQQYVSLPQRISHLRHLTHPLPTHLRANKTIAVLNIARNIRRIRLI